MDSPGSESVHIAVGENNKAAISALAAVLANGQMFPYSYRPKEKPDDARSLDWVASTGRFHAFRIRLDQ
jgi:hypothetical protein